MFYCQQFWQKLLFPRQKTEERPQVRVFPSKAAVVVLHKTSCEWESRFSPRGGSLGRHRCPLAASITGSGISWRRGAHPAEPEQLPGVRVGGEGTGEMDTATGPGKTGPACSPDSRGRASSLWDGS